MEHQRILSLLKKAGDFKFGIKKWNTANDQLNVKYGAGNEIIYNTGALKTNICDYNNAYILVGGDVTIIWHCVTQLAFKNCAWFTKFVIKIDGTTMEDAEDLDFAMYNLLECPQIILKLQVVYGFTAKIKH